MLTMLIQGLPRWLPTQEATRTSSTTANEPKPSAMPKLLLAAADSHIVSKEEQEQDHPDLDDANAALRGDDGLHPGLHFAWNGGDRDHAGDQQHNQPGPVKQHGARDRAACGRAENIDKDFVNHSKSESDAERLVAQYK